MKKIYGYLRKIHNYLIKISTIKYIILIPIINIMIYFFITLAFLLLTINTDHPTFSEQMTGSLTMTILSACLFAPIFETFIFQYGILKILRSINFFKNKNILNIIISSTLFTLNHYSSLFVWAKVFIVGFLFAYTFIIYEQKYNNKQTSIPAFWVVSIIHGLTNGIVTILYMFI